MAHRARSLQVRQRTMLANSFRGHLAELRLLANPAIANLAKLAQHVPSGEDALPTYAHVTLEVLVRQITTLSEEITALNKPFRIVSLALYRYHREPPVDRADDCRLNLCRQPTVVRWQR